MACHLVWQRWTVQSGCIQSLGIRALANKAAQAVLRELSNPDPPIPIEDFILSRRWGIKYDELYGPDGYMMKIVKNNRSKFFIFLAEDADPDTPYNAKTLKQRQYFTLAHELGHILLHGNFILNSHYDMSLIPDHIAGVMEVEAHWFASRLLMPNYTFKSITDLIPDQLAEKCNLNLTPALKRLKNLDQNIKSSLIQSVRLDKWPSDSINYLDMYPPDFDITTFSETWESLEVAVASSKFLLICSSCGFLHNEKKPLRRFVH